MTDEPRPDLRPLLEEAARVVETLAARLRPEVVDHLAAAAVELAAAVREFAAGSLEDPVEEPGAGDPDDGAAPAPQPAVEHIEITD